MRCGGPALPPTDHGRCHGGLSHGAVLLMTPDASAWMPPSTTAPPKPGSSADSTAPLVSRPPGGSISPSPSPCRHRWGPRARRLSLPAPRPGPSRGPVVPPTPACARHSVPTRSGLSLVPHLRLTCLPTGVSSQGPRGEDRRPACPPLPPLAGHVLPTQTFTCTALCLERVPSFHASSAPQTTPVPT